MRCEGIVSFLLFCCFVVVLLVVLCHALCVVCVCMRCEGIVSFLLFCCFVVVLLVVLCHALCVVCVCMRCEGIVPLVSCCETFKQNVVKGMAHLCGVEGRCAFLVISYQLNRVYT